MCLPIFALGMASNARGATGVIQNTPNSINFGSLVVGQSATQNVKLTWTGSTAIALTSDSISGAGFSLVGVSFPLTLQPKVPVTIPVRATASAGGRVTSQLSFTSGPAGKSSGVIGLTMTGTVPPTPRLLQASPSPLNFGTVALNGIATQSVTLTSVGQADLTILSAVISGGSFRITGGKVPYKLAPGKSIALQLQFTAATAGAVTGQLTLTSNATNGKTTTVPLSGSGGSGGTPQLSASPGTIDFGNVALNTPKDQVLTLSSTGTAALTISSATVSGTGYRLVSGALPVTLAPQRSTTLQLEFDPTSQGQKTGTITIVSNSSTNSSLPVTLSGSGQAAVHTVELQWTPPASSSDPVTGYNVYRSSGSQGFQKLNSQPQTQSPYTDSAVSSGTTYTYQVKSVDAHAVESAASNSTEVTIP